MNKSSGPFASIGVDIGKEVFHLVGFDGEGVVILRRKIKRSAFEREFGPDLRHR
jgi:transposase